MAKQTVLDKVKNRMKEMQDSKAAQLETIRQKQEEARTDREAADLAIKEATEHMNLEAYAEAKDAKRKAQTALDMYNGRYKQIKQQEYISEAESDSVVDSLLEYEKQLAEDFKAAAAVHLKKLAELLKDYKAAVQDTEDTITAWQRDIHANYNTRGAMTRTDPLTGEQTHRSERPIAVHTMPYTGCPEADRMGNYLEKEAPLVEG